MMLTEELFVRVPDLYKSFSSFLETVSSGKNSALSAVDILKNSRDFALEAGREGLDLKGDVLLSSGGSSSSTQLQSAAEAPLKANQTASSRLQLWRSRPISEIAAESTVTCTESYKKLPADFPGLACSGKTDLEKRTINDLWVSVPMGSEEFSNKNFKRNPHEDNLFRCEDDRYELDMVIETNAATIQRLEPIAATIEKLSVDDKRKHALADGALGAVNFRAVERIYGDQGAEVVEQLKLNPSVSVPVVLTRMKQKDEQWRKARLEMNKIWREVCEKNFFKALDHRSFNFKQADKKELSTKALLQEVQISPKNSATQLNTGNEIRNVLSLDPNGWHLPRHGGVQSRSLSGFAFSLSKVAFRDAMEIVRFSALWELHSQQNADGLVKEVETFLESFFDDDIAKSDLPSVIYGNEGMYLYFRYQLLLTERLAAARSLAEGQARIRRESNASMVNKTAFDDPKLECSNPPSALTQFGDAKESSVIASLAEDRADVLFEQFMTALKDLLGGNIDNAKYEERCRVVLGPSSYHLFTMDKVVHKYIKQVISVFPNSRSQARNEYLEMYNQMCLKPRQCERYYHATLMEHLRQNSETVSSFNVFRMEFRVVPTSELGGLLTSDGKTVESSGSLSLLHFSSETGKVKKVTGGLAAGKVSNAYQNEIDFVTPTVSCKTPGGEFRRASRRFLGAAAGEARAAVAKAAIQNGMGIRICPESSRMQFICGSEDFLYRKRKLSAGKAGKPSKKQRVLFREWLAKNV
mmetsp:Transcript_17762/g.45091  ORF Transcript_17762/g.45091 Transcript_17762/m.45091 type:complete len:753 (+) Transcript_17762:514-2772(+)